MQTVLTGIVGILAIIVSGWNLATGVRRLDTRRWLVLILAIPLGAIGILAIVTAIQSGGMEPQLLASASILFAAVAISERHLSRSDRSSRSPQGTSR